MRTPVSVRRIVCRGPKDYVLETSDMPELQPDEILTRVLACGICASDIKCFDGADNFWKGDPPFVRPPFVPGHEFIAEVVKVGSIQESKTQFAVGDHIVSEQIIPCGRCRFCLQGQYWMCQVHDIYGFRGGIADGGMAEYMKFSSRARNYKVSPEVRASAGALIEPLACAIHAVDRGRIRFNDVVVIAGAGTLGLLMLQVLRLRNPRSIIVIDPQENRRNLAHRLGAQVTLDPENTDVVSYVKESTAGYGCDVYMEASGSPVSVNSGLQMTRKLGRFVHFGIATSEITADWNIIGDQKELTIAGSHLSPYTYPVAIEFLERGLVKTEDIVTHRFDLAQFERAFAAAREQEKEQSIRVVFVPG